MPYALSSHTKTQFYLQPVSYHVVFPMFMQPQSTSTSHPDSNDFEEVTVDLDTAIQSADLRLRYGTEAVSVDVVCLIFVVQEALKLL